jgi:5,10-methylenetetrahydromethanopterin reductase
MVSLGVNIIPMAPVDELVSYGQEAERLGFDRFWVMDEGLATRDVYITLAAIAQKTNNILLGTGITNPYTRHPAVTAASIATLDELSGGRALLGIGAAGSLTLDPMLIERRKPLTAVGEVIETTRALFRGEVVTFDGEVVKLNGAHLDYARSDIEIWIAGRGPKMLTLGGRISDGISLNFNHRELIQENVDLILAGAKQTGNKPKIGYATFVITNEKMLQRLKPFMTFSLVDSPSKAKELIGITEAEVENIRQTMGREGLYAAGKLLKDEWVRPFVVMGSKSECAAELRALVARHNLDELMVPIYDMSMAMEQISDLAAVMSST